MKKKKKKNKSERIDDLKNKPETDKYRGDGAYRNIVQSWDIWELHLLSR